MQTAETLLAIYGEGPLESRMRKARRGQTEFQVNLKLGLTPRSSPYVL